MSECETSDRAVSVVLDLRHCVALEPLRQMLVACDALLPGASLTVLSWLRPAVLLPLLERRGVQHTVRALPDGCQVLRLTRDAGSGQAAIGLTPA